MMVAHIFRFDQITSSAQAKRGQCDDGPARAVVEKADVARFMCDALAHAASLCVSGQQRGRWPT
jgi:hypothetical protein